MDLSVDNSVNFTSSFYDKFFKSLPNKDIGSGAKLNKLGHALASPHWNRAALGVAAIATQPAFDYFNPRVDKDTAEASALRTASKIVVCTTVGFTIRGLSHKIIKKLTNLSPKEGSTLLTPKSILNIKNSFEQKNKLALHRNTLATLTALIVMMFTNFLIDAPLTTFVANKTIDHHNKKKLNKERIKNE
ncbi:hypothetical protein IJO12_01615 [bacterium]|nr:hypothetical protein [bacterium]